MKKSILLYGLIAGGIVTVGMLLAIYRFNGGNDMSGGEVYGYTGMLLAFSTIFIALWQYRKAQGSLPFKKAFLIGLGISVIASTMYTATWMIYSNTYAQDFMTKYAEAVEHKMEKDHVSQEVMQQKKAEMKRMVELYKNPLFKIGMTYLEILPLGLLISLIAAAIMRRKPTAT